MIRKNRTEPVLWGGGWGGGGGLIQRTDPGVDHKVIGVQ